MGRMVRVPGAVNQHVPFRIVNCGGRKEMQLPAGALEQRKTTP